MEETSDKGDGPVREDELITRGLLDVESAGGGGWGKGRGLGGRSGVRESVLLIVATAIGRRHYTMLCPPPT